MVMIDSDTVDFRQPIIVEKTYARAKQPAVNEIVEVRLRTVLKHNIELGTLKKSTGEFTELIQHRVQGDGVRNLLDGKSPFNERQTRKRCQLKNECGCDVRVSPVAPFLLH